MKKNKLIKKIILFGIFSYVCFIFISQESDLVIYRRQRKEYETQIQEEFWKAYNEINRDYKERRDYFKKL